MNLAEEYAFAESIENPSKKQVEQVNTISNEGNLTQITITAEPVAQDPGNASTMEEEIKVMEQTFDDHGNLKPPKQVTVSTEQPVLSQAPPPAPPRRPTVPAFRDAQWLQTERSYQELAIKELNSLTRSYNLMAPDLAKKVSMVLCISTQYLTVPPAILQSRTGATKMLCRCRTAGSSHYPRASYHAQDQGHRSHWPSSWRSSRQVFHGQSQSRI